MREGENAEEERKGKGGRGRTELKRRRRRKGRRGKTGKRGGGGGERTLRLRALRNRGKERRRTKIRHKSILHPSNKIILKDCSFGFFNTRLFCETSS